jgi:hypothetical protein
MLPIDPPAPIIDQLPTPIAGLFAAKVTIVNPQVVAFTDWARQWQLWV